MKVMSFNVRCPVDDDGINFFWNRTGRMLEMMRSEKPDLIGFQEMPYSGRDWLFRELGNEYLILGAGVGRDWKGEGTTVAVRWDSFAVVGMDQFWLSDTPDVPGTRFQNADQSICTRIAVAVKLIHSKTGRIVTFLNTHTDHQGALAREKGLLQIAKYLETCKGEKIVTGDMNATPDSTEIRAFLEAVKSQGIVESTAEVDCTFHCFGLCNKKIDYVFSSMKTVKSYAVEDTPIDGVYYSDHMAVCAELDFE